MKYRVGIIGCGFIGVYAPDNHLRAYQDCPDTELVALCDKYKDSFTIEKSMLKVIDIAENVYADYKNMVKEFSFDIVSVCTPPETHCQIVCDMAPFVKAIYCEKPIALTLEEADKMIRVCHQHNVILQVNHQRRFMPVKVRFSRGIENTGTHMFDRLRQLFGELEGVVGNTYLFGKQPVEIEYINSPDHIFEIDCVRSPEPMILKGVEHLVACLEGGYQSISSGEEARQTLALTLKFKEMYERNK